MTSRPKESLEETILPTPASTPAHNSESDSQSNSTESNTSAHTATPYQDHRQLNNTMASSSDQYGTPAQRQAAHITSVLHKTPIKPSLSATNYVAWSDSVRFGLSAASYNLYLESDDIDEAGLDESRHTATKKCIFHWLLANMETSQSTRFISLISTFENGVKTTPFAPALLWKTVRDYYVSNSESVKLMLRSEITNFKQGPSKDLLDHIEAFRTKIDSFLGANGKMDEEEQATQLVTSLNQEWCDKGCFFLDAGYITFGSLETELKKSYQTKKVTSLNQPPSSRNVDDSQGMLGRRVGRWITCNCNKCVGQDHPTKPHNPADCYHNPNNLNKMNEWKQAKQQAGEWVEYPRGTSQRSRGRGHTSNVWRSHLTNSSSNYPRSDDIVRDFESLKLEDRDVSYNVEIDGLY